MATPREAQLCTVQPSQGAAGDGAPCALCSVRDGCVARLVAGDGAVHYRDRLPDLGPEFEDERSVA